MRKTSSDGADGKVGAKGILGRLTQRVVQLKRAYEQPSPGDGVRVLVDRLWPRGLSKQQLAMDFWLKDAAPSDELRRWYGHRLSRWESFATKYRAELARRTDVLQLLDDLRRRGRVTLLYGAHDEVRNNAVVLRDVIEKRESSRRGSSERPPPRRERRLPVEDHSSGAS